MKKSMMVSGMHLGTEFLSALYKKVIELGGTEENMFQAMKTDSPLIEKWASAIIETTNTLKLKSLKLIQSNIEVSTKSFSKTSFKDGPIKYWISKNFQKNVLDNCPDTIPEFTGKLKKLQLTKGMNDFDILTEIGEQNVFSLEEGFAIFKSLTELQLKGQDGTLLNNGYANIIYVRLSDKSIIVVRTRWSSYDSEWALASCLFGGDGLWNVGRYVFVRD